jgi:tetratricopeptide (TPR) repeat protein
MRACSWRAGAVLLLTWAGGVGAAVNAELVEEMARAAAAGPSVQYLLGVAGELMQSTGQHERALALLDRALAANEEPDVGHYLAEIWRLRGHSLLALDRYNGDEGRRALAIACEVARDKGLSPSRAALKPRSPNCWIIKRRLA